MFENCEYGTLGQVAGKYEKNLLPADMVQFYSAQIAIFLSFIHRKGIIHRDLKPENILINAAKHIKVIDFGDSKYIDNSKNEEFRGYHVTESDEEEDENEEMV